MGWMLFYFYRKIAWKVWLVVWLAGGTWTWIIGRDAVHIGMSGWVYGLGFFLVVSAFLRRNRQLLAAAFLVILEYGSMVWGILPLQTHISWEGHLTGALAGIITAVYYRHIDASQVEKPREWPPEDEDDDPWWEENDDPANEAQNVHIIYTYKPKDPDQQ